MSTLVSLQALSRSFGNEQAVVDLSFDVAQGELFGIVGPDGAGKTTTLRMLAGVLPPSSGDAIVRGISVSQNPEGVKPHIAYMAQRFGLYEDLTVRENIDFYADLYRVPRADRPPRLERLFAFSNLGEFQKRLAGKLSGGMKQKLSLCCALIHQPEILLLDEPTFGVDPISRRDLWLILHEMVADGVTMIVTTSYLDEAERCDRVALLDHGRILALDAPAVLQQTLGGSLYAVVSATPRLARDTLTGSPMIRRASLFGDTLHVVAERDTTADQVRTILMEARVDVSRVERLDPSLEDVFIDLVGNVA